MRLSKEHILVLGVLVTCIILLIALKFFKRAGRESFDPDSLQFDVIHRINNKKGNWVCVGSIDKPNEYLYMEATDEKYYPVEYKTMLTKINKKRVNLNCWKFQDSNYTPKETDGKISLRKTNETDVADIAVVAQALEKEVKDGKNEKDELNGPFLLYLSNRTNNDKFYLSYEFDSRAPEYFYTSEASGCERVIVGSDKLTPEDRGMIPEATGSLKLVENKPATAIGSVWQLKEKTPSYPGRKKYVIQLAGTNLFVHNDLRSLVDNQEDAAYISVILMGGAENPSMKFMKDDIGTIGFEERISGVSKKNRWMEFKTEPVNFNPTGQTEFEEKVKKNNAFRHAFESRKQCANKQT